MRKKKFLDQISSALTRAPRGEGDQRTSGSIDVLKEENRRLARAVDELSMLNELAREIGAARSSEAIMDRIIKRSLRAVNAEQAAVTLVDKQADSPMRTMVRAMVTSSEHEQFHFNQNLLGWMHLNKRPLLSNSPGSDERFRGINWDESIHSILCVPLLVKSELQGVLTAYNKRGDGGFTEEDQRLLAIIALQSAQVIENARLYEGEKALLHMREEIRLASVIQLDLLPKAPPHIPGYDIAGHTMPAQLVGGDYFDFIPCQGNCWAICLGDVSGKGLPASLLMANLQATLRGQTLFEMSVKERIRRSNRLLFQSTDPEKFATLFYGVLDPRVHELNFSNAGHVDPYVFGAKEDPVRLSAGGVVLGAMEDFPFEEAKVSIHPGDLLVVFSDGITEAINAKEEQFGEERLISLIQEHRHDSAADLIQHITNAVHSYSGDVPQTDDLTLVAIRRTSS